MNYSKIVQLCYIIAISSIHAYTGSKDTIHMTNDDLLSKYEQRLEWNGNFKAEANGGQVAYIADVKISKSGDYSECFQLKPKGDWECTSPKSATSGDIYQVNIISQTSRDYVHIRVIGQYHNGHKTTYVTTPDHDARSDYDEDEVHLSLLAKIMMAVVVWLLLMAFCYCVCGCKDSCCYGTEDKDDEHENQLMRLKKPGDDATDYMIDVSTSFEYSDTTATEVSVLSSRE